MRSCEVAVALGPGEDLACRCSLQIITFNITMNLELIINTFTSSNDYL